MSHPHFVPCADAESFQSAIAPWLAEQPAPHALVCGIARGLATTPGAWAGVVSVAGTPVVALVQTPPWPVVCSSAGAPEPAVVALVADRLRARGVTAINGPVPWVEAITAALGVTITDRFGLRLHQLIGSPQLPRPVPGRARAVTSAELPLLQRWMTAFAAEAMPGDSADPLSREQVAAAAPQILVWAVDDIPVAMARQVRPLLGGWTIGAVYTPPELRGRGYGGAVVHALSTKLLAEGSTFVVLYTDLANPISNHLYARFGFVPQLDQCRLTWKLP